MRYSPTGMRIDFLDTTLCGSFQISSMTSHNATPLDVGFFRDEIPDLEANKIWRLYTRSWSEKLIFYFQLTFI